MKPEPTLREKIATLKCEGEVEGFEDRLCQDGNLTPEAKNLLALRLEDLRRRVK